MAFVRTTFVNFNAATAWRCVAALVLASLAFNAHSKPPVRNMTVELWVLTEEQAAQRYPQMQAGAGTVVRTPAWAEDVPEIQKVFVMNGERAQLKLNTGVPVQWVKTGVSASGTATASNGDKTSSQSQGADQTLTWMDTGQSLSALVRWPGGAAPAVLEIEVELSSVDDNARGHLPNPSKQRLVSTVAVPLGVWTTIAVTGGRAPMPQPGVYSAGAKSGSEQKLVQVRVLAP